MDTGHEQESKAAAQISELTGPLCGELPKPGTGNTGERKHVLDAVASIQLES